VEYQTFVTFQKKKEDKKKKKKKSKKKKNGERARENPKNINSQT
jgi:hypothetical protein